jgi:hypothetical protein
MTAPGAIVGTLPLRIASIRGETADTRSLILDDSARALDCTWSRLLTLRIPAADQ